MALKRGTSGAIDPSRIRRLLLIRSDDRVGNVLLTTPLMRALREGLPHARIDWLIAATRRPLVDGLFLADRLIPFDKRANRRNPLPLLSLLWQLQAAEYDVVIDAAHHDAFSLSTAMIARWTGAPVRIGHDRGDAAYFYSHPVPPPSEMQNDVLMKLELLKPLGLPSRGVALETALGRSEAVGKQADEVIEKARLKDRFVVVNPGARKPDRRFSGAGLGLLVKHLAQETGLRALVVWGPGEEELAQTIVSAARDAAVLAPATDLDLLSALLRRASLLITNDTGPMHLGVACGTSVMALFTADVANRWGHQLPTFRAVPAWPGAPDPVTEAEKVATELLGEGEARLLHEPASERQ
jgi:ADP-heptose:LPS heptosyltransferase